ncbi:hypothetical protein A2U01_0051600, partial [Trifolium medium]|nr:hypothetical protein [Trifolium medium]
MNVDHNTIFLYDNFKSVPTYILNPVLCQLGDYARRMVALNMERCGIWEMKVLLHVTSCINGNGQQIADLLDKLKVRPPSSNS